jgi:hypothetical protein
MRGRFRGSRFVRTRLLSSVERETLLSVTSHTAHWRTCVSLRLGKVGLTLVKLFGIPLWFEVSSISLYAFKYLHVRGCLQRAATYACTFCICI